MVNDLILFPFEQMMELKMKICIAEIILAACISFIAGMLTTKFTFYKPAS